MEEYITIKEFAMKVNLSTQAIYQRLDKDLQPFVKLFDGKKRLNINALELFSQDKNESYFASELSKNMQENCVVTNLQSGLPGNTQVSLRTFQDIIHILQTQLDIKDVQLSEQLKNKDLQISELNERLKEAQALNRNNQLLLGVEQNRVNQILVEKTKKRSFLDILFNRQKDAEQEEVNV